MTVDFCCAGCLGSGPCDDGTACAYGCGGYAANPWGTCGPCEDEATGRYDVYATDELGGDDT